MKKSVLIILAIAIAAGVVYMTQSKTMTDMAGSDVSDNNTMNSNIAPINTDQMAPASDAPAAAPADTNSAPAATPSSMNDATSNVDVSAAADQANTAAQQAQESAESAAQSAESKAVNEAAAAGAAASNPENSAQTTR